MSAAFKDRINGKIKICSLALLALFGCESQDQKEYGLLSDINANVLVYCPQELSAVVLLNQQDDVAYRWSFEEGRKDAALLVEGVGRFPISRVRTEVVIPPSKHVVGSVTLEELVTFGHEWDVASDNSALILQFIENMEGATEIELQQADH